jgi:hypothetical protein
VPSDEGKRQNSSVWLRAGVCNQRQGTARNCVAPHLIVDRQVQPIDTISAGAVTLLLSFGYSLPKGALCRASSSILLSTVVNSRYSFGRKLLFRLHVNEDL